MTVNSFDIQELSLSTGKWRVDLYYEGSFASTKTIVVNEDDFVIELSERGEKDSTLKVNLTHQKTKRTFIISGIQGSVFLYQRREDEMGQTVKIDGDELLLSLGVNFVLINLETLTLQWKLEPDVAEIFEFYDLEDDYLLRGEVGIHRIDKLGKVKWTFTGKDIWLNMEGRPEVEINESSIKLVDFGSNEYEIGFDGKSI